MSAGVGMDWIRFRCVFSDPVYGFGRLCAWRAGGWCWFCQRIVGIPLISGVVGGGLPSDARMDWIGFRCSFSGLVRGLGASGGLLDGG